jgi:hypothetical protein
MAGTDGPFTVKCPVCGREAAWEGNPDRPFCSERCRLIDLGAWADERYKIPGEDDDEERGEGTEEEGR